MHICGGWPAGPSFRDRTHYVIHGNGYDVGGVIPWDALRVMGFGEKMVCSLREGLVDLGALEVTLLCIVPPRMAQIH